MSWNCLTLDCLCSGVNLDWNGACPGTMIVVDERLWWWVMGRCLDLSWGLLNLVVFLFFTPVGLDAVDARCCCRLCIVVVWMVVLGVVWAGGWGEFGRGRRG